MHSCSEDSREVSNEKVHGSASSQGGGKKKVPVQAQLLWTSQPVLIPLLPVALVLRKPAQPAPILSNDGGPRRDQGDSGESALASRLIQFHLLL